MTVNGRDGDGDDELNLEELSDEIIRRYQPDRLLASIRTRVGRGEPLDWSTRNKFERRLGIDLSDVRIYSNETARSITRAKGAEALTIGKTRAILMGGSGDRSPITASGMGLLAHELTHVAQAKDRLHPSSVGETTGPFAQDGSDEVAAHRAEEAVANEEAGSPAGSKRGLTEAEYLRILHESTITRVLEMFQDDHVVLEMRGGRRRWRP